MAIYYIDIMTGNDTTGNGSAGNPWKLYSKAQTVMSEGDELRIAKTTAPTAIAVNCTWTQKSKTITTSSSLVGIVNVGDYIGKGSGAAVEAAGNGASETYYRIASMTTTTLTIEMYYIGETETCNIKKLNFVSYVDHATNGMSIAPAYGLTVSGGWNLSGTPTRDGETWWANASTSLNRLTTNRYALVIGSNPSCSYLNVCETYYGTTSYGTDVSNVTAIGYMRGEYLAGIYNKNYENCCFVSQANSASGYGMDVNRAATMTLNNVTVITLYITIYSLTANSNITLNNCILGGIATTSGGHSIAYSTLNNCKIVANDGAFFRSQCVFNNCLITNNLTGISGTDGNDPLVIRNCEFTNNTYAFNASGRHPTIIENCTFTGNGYDIYSVNNNNDLVINNCSFNNPVNYSLYRSGSAIKISCNGCTIDSGSIAKAYAGVAYGIIYPAYIFQNSFGITGLIGNTWSILSDNTTYRTTGPSLAWSTSNVSYAALAYRKILSTWTKSGVGRTFKFYMKCSSAFSATMNIKFYLNGVDIYTPTAITTIDTATWTEYNIDCPSMYVTMDGELSMMASLTGAATNTYYFDDFSTTAL